MAEWIETYRGSVAPWECDVTEHFTIAYYLDRVDQAASTLADSLGLADSLRTGVSPRHFNLRFAREVRAGDSFHVESAAIGLDPALRLGHRIVDSGSGEIVTWVEEVWGLPSARLSVERRAAIGQQIAVWEGPPTEPRPEPRTAAAPVAAHRDRAERRIG
jgi:acyl-CoA thioesterase FadM